MRSIVPKIPPVGTEVIIFQGGLKEDVSQLEMKPGELISGFNYQLRDGVTHGYTSVAGYERFDGTQLASDIDANPEDETAREARRSAITEVPGTGDVSGVHIYNTDVFAIRDGASNALMYKSTGTGWSAALTSVSTIANGGSYEFINTAFSLLTGHQREKLFFFCNGVNNAMYYDGTQLQDITHANLPSTVYPTRITEFKGRLWLGYEDGRLYFSAIEDPLDFDPVNGAGVFEFGQPITNLIVTPGDTLAVFCTDKIETIASIYDVQTGVSGNDTLSIYKFKKDEFSREIGAYPKTVQRILGKIYYMDDRGITSLEASDIYGDFTASAVSKNVQGTLLSKRNIITVSAVSREDNQYRLYFNDGTGYIVTFDKEKKVKGITSIMYNIPVLGFSEGKDSNGDDFRVFFSNTGYIYKMDSGTSFDGEVINTRLTTAFYSYKSPSSWKKFIKLTLEATASSLLEIKGKTEFNYRSTFMPKSTEQEYETGDSGGTWGVDRWGSFVYSSSVIQSPSIYITGVGSSMSITLVTSNKFANQHTLHNAIVEYSMAGRVA